MRVLPLQIGRYSENSYKNHLSVFYENDIVV